MQYRSQAKDNFVVAGYQADFEAADRYSGILYDEGGGAGGRGIMAERGEIVAWNADGEKQVTGRLESSAAIQSAIKKDDWNEYTIIARGNHLQHFINGKQTIDVVDETAGKRLASGVLALQIHAGEPMTVAMKDVRIKSLSAAENVALQATSRREGFQARIPLLRTEGERRLVGGQLPGQQRADDCFRSEWQALPFRIARTGARRPYSARAD